MPLYVIGNKTVFFAHVPKTGGASIERILAETGREYLKSSHTPAGLPCPPQHFPAAVVEKLVPACDFSFAVVRNPYDRAISEFLFRFAERERSLPSFDAWWAYVVFMYKRNSYLHSNHIRPQRDFITDSTKIYRFEDGIGRILADVTRIIGVESPETVPHKKRSPLLPVQISAKTLQSIATFYAADFEEFGYSRDFRSVVASRGVVVKNRSMARWLLSAEGMSFALRGAAHAFRPQS